MTEREIHKLASELAAQINNGMMSIQDATTSLSEMAGDTVSRHYLYDLIRTYQKYPGEFT